tara:strand:- start:40 stop:819 length:780 start_codon:yes stop_codon:yes gene_type:complete
MEKIDQYKKNFTENGFIKIENIFLKKEIKEIILEIEKIKKSFTKNIKNPNFHLTKDKKINTIHDINKFIKKGLINKLSKDKRITSVVDKILGEKSEVRNIEFFLKPRKTGKKAPLHQDNFYWNIPNKKALNVWIACSSSNSKNGGVFYYVKSHKDGLIDHELSLQAGSSQQIPRNLLKKNKYKKYYPNLNAGDCIIHHCEIIHGSDQNKSIKDRVGIVLSYKSKKAKLDKKGWNRYQNRLRKNLAFLKKTNSGYKTVPK